MVSSENPAADPDPGTATPPADGTNPTAPAERANPTPPAAMPTPTPPTDPQEAARLKAERKREKKARKAEERRRRRQRLAIGWIATGLGTLLIYGLVLYAYGLSATPTPKTPLVDPTSIGVYVQPTTFVAAENLLNAEISVTIPEELAGSDMRLDHKLSVLLFTPSGSREIVFPEGAPVLTLTGTTTIRFDTGQYADYPVDRYNTWLGVITEVDLPTGAVRYPTESTLWGDLAGWRISSAAEKSENIAPVAITDDPSKGAALVDITMRRAGSTLSIVALMLVAMIAVAVLATVIAVAVSRRLRRVEATMASWFAALLFAVVPLRLNMPGAPPIGVWIDFLVFMWVVLVLMLALVVFIGSWVRFSARPEVAGKDKRKEPAGAGKATNG